MDEDTDDSLGPLQRVCQDICYCLLPCWSLERVTLYIALLETFYVLLNTHPTLPQSCRWILLVDSSITANKSSTIPGHLPSRLLSSQKSNRSLY